jgi:hypothetical protein
MTLLIVCTIIALSIQSVVRFPFIVVFGIGVRTTHVDNLNQILVFMRSNRFTLLNTSWEERVMILSLDWVHKLVHQGILLLLLYQWLDRQLMIRI